MHRIGERGAWLAVPAPGLFDFATFVGLSLPWLFFSISNPPVSQRLFTTELLGAMRTMIAGFLVLGDYRSPFARTVTAAREAGQPLPRFGVQSGAGTGTVV